jgi:Protein of unknown function (DUF3164)
MTQINLSALSAADRKALMKEAAELEKHEKLEKTQKVATYKSLASEFAQKHVDAFLSHKNKIDELIHQVWAEFKSMLELKEDVFGAQVNQQDSHTCSTPNGQASLTIGYNVNIVFDGSETAGIQHIKDYIASLATDDDKVQKLSKMVNTFLKPNGKTGMLNPTKIIELSKLRDEFADQRFNQGLDIIFAAQQRQRSNMYVSGYKFIDRDSHEPMKLEFRFTI